MLSILIPTYNYDVFPLVEELYKQCSEIDNLEFEILVNDDASKEIIPNTNIEFRFDNCTLFIQTENKGLSYSRNFLISKAKFSWILLLDSDVFPVNKLYILNYLKYTNSNYHIINGGLQYYNFTPFKEELLRWKYGKKREALTINQRLTKRNKESFFSSNLLVHKSVFENILYDTNLNKYGYEDLFFQKQANLLNFKILQIDNSVYHLKLDTSEIFLNKTETSLENLSYLIKSNKLDFNDTRITKIYKLIKFSILRSSIVFLFDISRKRMYNNLKSSKTNIFIFDLYRIGYFFKIHTQNIKNQK